MQTAVREKICELRKQIILAEKAVEEEEHLEKIQLQNLRVQKDQIKHIENCEQRVTNISDLNDLIPRQKDCLFKLQFILESRQIFLINKLSEIYPISKQCSNGDFSFTIRGLDLNDNEICETALGYLVHLLLLISKYLDCPLRYQLLYYSSRSMIKDIIAFPALASATATTQGVILPLYRRGIERERFELAIQWVKCDIQQIMLCRQLSYNIEECMLANMYRFFTFEN